MDDKESPDRGRDRERSRRGDRPSRFSSSTRDRSPVRDSHRRKGDRRVYVSNVAYESKWQDIKDLFRAEVGEVTYVELFVDEHDKPRGCGIVEFETPEIAARAVEKMHRFDLKGRKLVVKEDSDVIRDKHGRPITRGSNRGDDGGGSSSSNHRRDDGGGRGGTWDGSNQHPPHSSNLPSTPSGGMGGGSNSGNNSKYGNTYGLSTSFLESLWVNGPLVCKVFVANLDYKVDQAKLREVFKLAGKVVDCEISLDKDGKSRGFGVVEYDHPVEAVQAISLLHNQTLFDRRLTVRMDRVEKPEGPPKLPEGLKSIGLGLGPNGTILHDVPRNLPNTNQSNNNNAPQVAPTNVQLQAAMAAATAAAQAQLVNQGLGNLPLAGPNPMAPTLSNVSGILGQSLNVPELTNLNSNQPFGSSNQSQMSGLSLNVGMPSGLGVGQSGLGSFNAMTSGNNQNSLNANNMQNSNTGFVNNFESISAALSGNNPGSFSGFERRDNMNMRENNYNNGASRGLGNNGRGGNLGMIQQGNNNFSKRSDTIVVKNLPPNTEWRQLVDKFREAGEIVDVQTGKDTALIRFKNDWEADRAVQLRLGLTPVLVEQQSPMDRIFTWDGHCRFLIKKEVKEEPCV
ncbi:myelin expression factor 2 isoform X2 [Frankliniella occidentalis]|uniref:Myelin expression factor 2 isoform X2 n=1 Tax=Frankliniella occidentalis TaxID=133901 RepID=A0A9C6WT60_FRAOC|nr:myelin expression factor 2 isoform X2 [Frankliniella occidentalis]